MRAKGFRYHCTLAQIRAYRKLSPADKVNWLEAANQITAKALRGKRREIWELFRRGDI
jgi:hypothetical protein